MHININSSMAPLALRKHIFHSDEVKPSERSRNNGWKIYYFRISNDIYGSCSTFGKAIRRQFPFHTALAYDDRVCLYTTRWRSHPIKCVCSFVFKRITGCPTTKISSVKSCVLNMKNMLSAYQNTHTHTYKLICTHLRSTLINNWNLFIPGSVKQMYVFICETAYVGSDLSGNDDI